MCRTPANHAFYWRAMTIGSGVSAPWRELTRPQAVVTAVHRLPILIYHQNLQWDCKWLTFGGLYHHKQAGHWLVCFNLESPYKHAGTLIFISTSAVTKSKVTAQLLSKKTNQWSTVCLNSWHSLYWSRRWLFFTFALLNARNIPRFRSMITMEEDWVRSSFCISYYRSLCRVLN